MCDKPDWEGFFKFWDKDGNGSLDVKELTTMMMAEPLNLSKEDAEKETKTILEYFDNDKDKKVTLEEFLKVMA